MAFFTAFIPSFISLILNLTSHHNPLVSILNSLSLGSSVYFSQIYLRQSASIFNTFLVISLGLIPLFYYIPKEAYFSLLPLLTLGFIYLAKRNISYIHVIVILFGLFFFIGNIILSEIVKYPFKIQLNQLIFNTPELNNNIFKHQQDALFIPYKIRLVIYSKLIYFYALLINLFNTLTLKSLSDTLLIANLYPLFIGVYDILRQRSKMTYFYIVAFLITALTVGIDRSTDKFQSVYLLGPMLVILILLGAQRINKKIFLSLWILSLFILLSPKL